MEISLAISKEKQEIGPHRATSSGNEWFSLFFFLVGSKVWVKVKGPMQQRSNSIEPLTAKII